MPEGLEAVVFTADGDMRQVRGPSGEGGWVGAAMAREGFTGANTLWAAGGAAQPQNSQRAPRSAPPRARFWCSVPAPPCTACRPGNCPAEHPAPCLLACLAPIPPQALNNLQATCTGFGDITAENVFRVRKGEGGPRNRGGAGQGAARRPPRQQSCAGGPVCARARTRAAFATQQAPLPPGSRRAAFPRHPLEPADPLPPSHAPSPPPPPSPQVCDQPHPKLVREMLGCCAAGQLESAYTHMKALCDQGYSAMDIITTLFRVGPAGQKGGGRRGRPGRSPRARRPPRRLLAPPPPPPPPTRPRARARRP
jgi:hypothetical protein